MPEARFSEDVLIKARRLLARMGVRPDPMHPTAIWWVAGSDQATTYRVQSDYNPSSHHASWITCTCPHGLNAGGGSARCYHAAAVLIRLQEIHDEERHAILLSENLLDEVSER